MKLESQVVSLELSKKLKELGVKQESVFYWGWFQGYAPEGSDGKGILYFSDYHDIPELAVEQIASAFTVAELGEMLPINIFSGRIKGTKSIGEFYSCFMNDQGGPSEFQMTEADARAKMLVYLIEQGIVKP